MEHLPQGVKDEEGCFVYRVLERPNLPLAVRTQLNVGDEVMTKILFHPNELVSVDLVRPSRCLGSRNGPFLRLSDASGWLFEKKYGETMMERLPVETDLFTFFIDNYPSGIGLRSHPVDDRRFVDEINYKPMQKVVCDRRVKHPVTGVNFYRVQGTEGWIFDRRPLEGGGFKSMLLPEDKVEEGLQVYECLGRIGIRLTPNISESFKIDRSVDTGELVAIDISRTCPIEQVSNGPFLRLTDGSGWVFQRKNGSQVMIRRTIQTGTWTLRIENSVGLALRSQPMDSGLFKTGVIHSLGEVVRCTHMVQASSGVKFYKVTGKDGWIFDRRGEHPMLTVLSEDENGPSTRFQASLGVAPWTPDFVRGVVATLSNEIEEVSLNEQSRVISFRNTSAGVRINVYYTTRTIGTALYHPSQGRTQLFRRNCTNDELIQILQDPRVHTGKGYKRKYRGDYAQPDPVVTTPHGQGILADQEAEARNRLVELGSEMKILQKEERQLLARIRSADLERAKEAKSMGEKISQRTAEFRSRIEQQEEKQRKRAREAQLLAARTCSDCGRVFQNEHAQRQHWNAVHRIYCAYCDRDFQNHHALRQHQDSLGHYY